MTKPSPGPVPGPLGDYEHHLYEEVAAGRLSRRELFRRATVMGLSLPTIGAILSACGTGATTSASPSTSAAPAKPRAGGTARIGSTAPTTTPDPVTMYDEGGILSVQPAGEYLAWPRTDYSLSPRLAVSWSAKSPSEWVFKLRPGVKFHDGQTMTADDVVATMDRLTNPSTKSAALSAFKGILSAGGTEKLGPGTVAFHLDSPFVDFPYLVSAFNYNAVILPKSYTPGSFMKGGMGTGAFMVKSYTPGRGATYVRNPHYWAAGLPHLDGLSLTYYQSGSPMVLAMQGGALDVLPLAPYGSQALFADPKLTKLKAPSSSYRTLQMRTDLAPFNDVRVREAVALCLDRPGIVAGVLSGDGQVGNDHAFAPVFPLSKLANEKIPQRRQDYAKARHLLSAAGHPGGLDVTLTTEHFLEVPTYAVFVQQQCKPAGIRVHLNVETQTAYYGSGTNQPWLQVPFGITDWTARGVPSQLILPAYTCGGVWNSAHWCDPAFDTVFSRLNATLDEQSRLQLALQAARIQHDAVPDAIAYWITQVRVTTATVHGLAAGPAAALDPRSMWLS